jgi:hypothetical protein
VGVEPGAQPPYNPPAGSRPLRLKEGQPDSSTVQAYVTILTCLAEC